MNYSLDEKDWDPYKDNGTKIAKVFDGSWDAETIISQYLDRKVRARYVRFLPTAWKTPGSICMRVEVYECIYYEACFYDYT
ncbi:hypothetical protein QZH41_001630 [Actinostola sp. cb2023]|nr:hypothetical protein QZH41_001630 [Actinostola sp. cb2023]